VSALRIGLVQMRVADGDAARNLGQATALIRGAPRADLYLLPELWSTGYAYACWRSSAEHETPGLCNALRCLSAERGAWIGGSLVSLDEQGRLTNRLWLLAPTGGEPTVYDKGHLFPPLEEHRRFTAGTKRVRVPMGAWTAALSICFDLRFPEMYRRDALDGANLFLVVAEWPESRAAALAVLARARAIENHAFLALSNRCGSALDGVRFGGGSGIFAPDGSVVVDAGSGEGVAVGMIDLAQAGAARATAPALELRQAGLDW